MCAFNVLCVRTHGSIKAYTYFQVPNKTVQMRSCKIKIKMSTPTWASLLHVDTATLWPIQVLQLCSCRLNKTNTSFCLFQRCSRSVRKAPSLLVHYYYCLLFTTLRTVSHVTCATLRLQCIVGPSFSPLAQQSGGFQPVHFAANTIIVQHCARVRP